jgi:hypothetical protein
MIHEVAWIPLLDGQEFACERLSEYWNATLLIRHNQNSETHDLFVCSLRGRCYTRKGWLCFCMIKTRRDLKQTICVFLAVFTGRNIRKYNALNGSYLIFWMQITAMSLAGVLRDCVIVTHDTMTRSLMWCSTSSHIEEQFDTKHRVTRSVRWTPRICWSRIQSWHCSWSDSCSF